MAATAKVTVTEEREPMSAAYVLSSDVCVFAKEGSHKVLLGHNAVNLVLFNDSRDNSSEAHAWNSAFVDASTDFGAFYKSLINVAQLVINAANIPYCERDATRAGVAATDVTSATDVTAATDVTGATDATAATDVTAATDATGATDVTAATGHAGSLSPHTTQPSVIRTCILAAWILLTRFGLVRHLGKLEYEGVVRASYEVLVIAQMVFGCELTAVVENMHIRKTVVDTTPVRSDDKQVTISDHSGGERALNGDSVVGGRGEGAGEDDEASVTVSSKYGRIAHFVVQSIAKYQQRSSDDQHVLEDVDADDFAAWNVAAFKYVHKYTDNNKFVITPTIVSMGSRLEDLQCILYFSINYGIEYTPKYYQWFIDNAKAKNESVNIKLHLHSRRYWGVILKWPISGLHKRHPKMAHLPATHDCTSCRGWSNEVDVYMSIACIFLCA